MQRERSRILDTFYLVCAAILVCVLGIRAFALAYIYHISPLWLFFGMISVAFIAMAREEYRKEFRSLRFVAFVIGWLVINAGATAVALPTPSDFDSNSIGRSPLAFTAIIVRWRHKSKKRSHRLFPSSRRNSPRYRRMRRRIRGGCKNSPAT